MEQKIADVMALAMAEVEAASTIEELELVRVKFLGKKSPFGEILRSLKDLSAEQKRAIGPVANDAKKEVTSMINNKFEALENAQDADREWIDVTAPGEKVPRGHSHPLTIVQRDIEQIFAQMGFEIADGPDVETEFYNFDAVNVPADHPARDMQDTFFINVPDGEEKQVLRTHTSSVQVRYMQKHTPPFRIIIPGRVFRNEATDSTHDHTFHQFEALVVDDDISVANFLDIAQKFFSQFFARDIKVKLRPSYFPFVEPGFEFDISCTTCGGSGTKSDNARCGACKATGWLEIGGAGMVHQNVLAAGGYKRNQYQGFAWGFGLERLAMMKYKIDDIRHFHSGDNRVSKQF